MAFSGKLIYAGSGNGTAIPTKYMKQDSIELTVHVQDLDSTRNANGSFSFSGISGDTEKRRPGGRRFVCASGCHTLAAFSIFSHSLMIPRSSK